MRLSFNERQFFYLFCHTKKLNLYEAYVYDILYVERASILETEKHMQKEYRSVVFDSENKKYEIKDGTIGIYPFGDVKKCSILNEEAKYRGKTKPFFHQILGGTAFFTIMGEPSFYVGLRIITKSNETLAIYVSTKSVYFNTDAYFADRAEAEKIQKVFQAIIKKQNE